MSTKTEERFKYLQEDIDKDVLGFLIEFSEVGMKSCGSFVRALRECKTNRDLKDLFSDYNVEISRHIGVEDKINEVEDLENQIHSLERELWILDDKVVDTPTLWDEQKLQIFLQNKDRFTPWEFEQLMRR